LRKLCNFDEIGLEEEFGECEYDENERVHVMEEYPGQYTYYCDKHWKEYLESSD
jgi:plastocyanin